MRKCLAAPMHIASHRSNGASCLQRFAFEKALASCYHLKHRSRLKKQITRETVVHARVANLPLVDPYRAIASFEVLATLAAVVPSPRSCSQLDN